MSREEDRASRPRHPAAWLRGQSASTLLFLCALILATVYSIVRGTAHYLRFRPRPCPKGHGAMRLLSEEEDDSEIGEGARFEERIESVNYDVWRCRAAGCSERLIIPRTNWMSGYSDCPHCHTRALTSSTVTLVAATSSSTGVEDCMTTCAFCKTSRTTRHITPILPAAPPPASSESSAGSSSSFESASSGDSGSSFGGSGGTAGGGGGDSY